MAARAGGRLFGGISVVRARLATLVAEANVSAIATPEAADVAIARVAAAQALLRTCYAKLDARAERLIGGEGWCCKHFSARWVASSTTTWKDAALLYLSPSDLAGFRSETESVVLTPEPDGAFARRHDGLASMLDDGAVASVACAVRGLVVVGDALDVLDGQRTALRTSLLGSASAGYAPRHARIDRRSRVSTEYRAAVAALAAKADLAPFTSTAWRLRIRRRDPSACRDLFG